jgi:DNA repair photolyase
LTLISGFNSSHSPLCTCPPKLKLNPYSGCDHGCVYCYATSYARSDFSRCTPNKQLSKLEDEASKLRGEIVFISNSSDPYPTVEDKNGVTRTCLETLSKQDCRIQIVTKSSLVTRDIDLLKRIPSVVSLTITTDDDQTAKMIEPNAPPPSDRLKAVEKLVQDGVPTTVRIDPIIPFVNDKPEKLVKTLAALGVRQITSKTYHVKPDNWARLEKAMPAIAAKLRPLYFERGEKVGSYLYLPLTLRSELMENLAASARNSGIPFAACTEGLSHLNTVGCDGTWLTSQPRA